MKIAIIVPALQNNKYHEKGDLAPFGDVSILEWKLSQLRNIKTEHTIYVSSPDVQIGELAKREQAHFTLRSDHSSLTKMIHESIVAVSEETILWANVTSPFLSAKSYQKMIDKFIEVRQEKDSLIAANTLQEYCYFHNKPLNFNPEKHASRKTIEGLTIITNGCFIISRKKALERDSFFGDNPFFYEVGHLAAMEIKDIVNYSLSLNMLAFYFKNEEL
jgi:CMP-N-acetylneuraminic acid synthetase